MFKLLACLYLYITIKRDFKRNLAANYVFFLLLIDLFMPYKMLNGCVLYIYILECGLKSWIRPNHPGKIR